MYPSARRRLSAGFLMFFFLPRKKEKKKKKRLGLLSIVFYIMSFARSLLRRRVLDSRSLNARGFSTGVTPTLAAAAPVAVLPEGTQVLNGLPDISFLGPSFLDEGFPSWWPLLWPQYGLMKIVEGFHEHGGLEWCSAVVATSIALRAGTFFLFIRSNRTGALLQCHQESIGEFNKRMEVLKAAGDKAAQQAVVKDYFAFLKSVDINLGKGMVLPTICNILLAGSFFTGLRKLALQAHTIPGLLEPSATSGWWLKALHLPDPTYILPASSIVFSIAAIYATNNIQGYPQADLSPGGQKLIFASLSGLFNIVALNFPAVRFGDLNWLVSFPTPCAYSQPYPHITTLTKYWQSVQIYLAVTSASMLLQQSALRVPAFRQAFGYPSGWPLSQEVIDARFAKAATSETKSQFSEALVAMKPFFRFNSALARGRLDFNELRGPPKQTYLGFFGLRDPGAPPPPPTNSKPV